MRHNEFDREMTPAPRERKTKTADEALQSLMRLAAINLRQKGVAQSIIDDALQQIDNEALADRLADRLSRKAKCIKASNDYEFRAKLIRYGLSLGYDYETIENVLNTIKGNTANW